MIVFNLTCTHQHTFEGWFASGEAFDHQLAKGMLTCPSCGDHQITRLPSGPHLSKGVVEPVGTATQETDLQKILEGLRQVLENSEDVGEAFALEARRIQHQESPQRNIRGVATLGEAKAMLEEGLPVLPMPLLSKKDLH